MQTFQINAGTSAFIYMMDDTALPEDVRIFMSSQGQSDPDRPLQASTFQSIDIVSTINKNYLGTVYEHDLASQVRPQGCITCVRPRPGRNFPGWAPIIRKMAKQVMGASVPKPRPA